MGGVLGVWAVLDKGRHIRRPTRGHDPGQYCSELYEMAQECQIKVKRTAQRRGLPPGKTEACGLSQAAYLPM